ncbi:hypothetical protein [Streptomyces sp. NPDC055036]
MTVIAAPITPTNRLPADAVLDGVTAEHELSDVAAQVPELEWCNFCSHGEACEPGMAREVAKRVVAFEHWGQGPLYKVTHLSCGHILARLR